MSLKKKLLLLTLLLGVATATSVAFWPEEAEALNCVRCPQFFANSPGQWGMGSTCAQAEANARIAAEDWVYTNCQEVCAIGNSTIVTACNFSNGMWKADASIQYKCGINLCQ